MQDEYDDGELTEKVRVTSNEKDWVELSIENAGGTKVFDVFCFSGLREQEVGTFRTILHQETEGET